MAVFRVHKSKDFTVMSNHHLRNRELSAKAKGILSTMLSLPDEWDYSIAGLTSLFKDGKDSVMAGLDELESAGYIYMDKQRDDKGRFVTHYDVYELPNRETRCGKSESVNPPQYNTNLFSTDSLSTNNIEDNSSRIINNTSNNISSPKNLKKGLDLSFVATEYIQPFGEWLEYKKSVGKMYKTQRGVRRAYNDLLKACGNNPQFALAVVNDCIDREYVGICLTRDLKEKLYGNSNQTQQPVNRFVELAKAYKAAGGIL